MRGKERTELLLLFWLLYIYLRDQRYPFYYYYVLFRVFSAVMCGVCNIVSSCDVRNRMVPYSLYCSIRAIKAAEPLLLVSRLLCSFVSLAVAFHVWAHLHTHTLSCIHAGRQAYISFYFQLCFWPLIFRLLLGFGERDAETSLDTHIFVSLFEPSNRLLKRTSLRNFACMFVCAR